MSETFTFYVVRRTITPLSDPEFYSAHTGQFGTIRCATSYEFHEDAELAASESGTSCRVQTLTYTLDAEEAAESLMHQLSDHAKRLRETATGLDDKSIHPAHAANRLRKMARGIDGGK
jgi:hypothetical protein